MLHPAHHSSGLTPDHIFIYFTSLCFLQEVLRRPDLIPGLSCNTGLHICICLHTYMLAHPHARGDTVETHFQHIKRLAHIHHYLLFIILGIAHHLFSLLSSLLYLREFYCWMRFLLHFTTSMQCNYIIVHF